MSFLRDLVCEGFWDFAGCFGCVAWLVGWVFVFFCFLKIFTLGMSDGLSFADSEDESSDFE